MEAKELRIGNLIKAHTGEYATVIGIFNDGCIAYEITGTDFNLLFDPEAPDLFKPEPIELTEEITNSIKTARRNNPEIWIGEEENLFIFEEYHDGFYYTGGEGVQLSTPFKYLHQLQNLYFAITGTELELK